MKFNSRQLVIIILLLIFKSTNVFAQGQVSVTASTQQDAFSFKNIVPTSPEAALLGRFGDIPVGNYTGTTGISIPFYTIKVDGLEVPINLTYHSSGIRSKTRRAM